jgi:hypothetical protein
MCGNVDVALIEILGRAMITIESKFIGDFKVGDNIIRFKRIVRNLRLDESALGAIECAFFGGT